MLERCQVFPVETILSSKRNRVIIAPHHPLVMIGERINPSDRRRLAKSLAQGEMSLVRREARARVEVGAQVIDVDVSAADVDEERILPLAATLTVCLGKPLVNSVTGEKASLEAVLPLVKEHACAWMRKASPRRLGVGWG